MQPCHAAVGGWQMHTIDVKGQIVCPICDHTVRCYQDDGGSIAWCYWCGAVAEYAMSAEPTTGRQVAHALRESAEQNLLARALLNHSRTLRADTTRLAEAIEAIFGQCEATRGKPDH